MAHVIVAVRSPPALIPRPRGASGLEQAASPLNAPPYDFRHAAVSLWLIIGVPATEVAQRAGHSVEILQRVYAKCVEGQALQANNKITAALDD